jgi:hypothetical protein
MFYSISLFKVFIFVKSEPTSVSLLILFHALMGPVKIISLTSFSCNKKVKDKNQFGTM